LLQEATEAEEAESKDEAYRKKYMASKRASEGGSDRLNTRGNASKKEGYEFLQKLPKDRMKTEVYSKHNPPRLPCQHILM